MNLFLYLKGIPKGNNPFRVIKKSDTLSGAAFFVFFLFPFLFFVWFSVYIFCFFGLCCGVFFSRRKGNRHVRHRSRRTGPLPHRLLLPLQALRRLPHGSRKRQRHPSPSQDFQ